MLRLLYALVAAGTALTNSTTETVLASTQLPANALQAGQVYREQFAVIATATNSTDTLRVRARIGPTTLTGTVVADGTAVDVANSDVIVGTIECNVRSVSTVTATVICSGLVSVEGAETTATARVQFEELSLTTTSAQNLEITGVWSVANAGNSCRADQFDVWQGI